MGFWRGVAEGMKDSMARRERREERDHQRQRDEISDNRYQEQLDYQRGRDALSDKRYDEQLADAKAEREWDRMFKIQTTLGVSGGLGGTSTGSTKTGASAAQAAADATMDLADQVKTAAADGTMDASTVDYFKQILADPMAAQGVLEFMNSMAEDGSPVDINDMPNIIKILGESQGMSKEEFNTLIKDTDWGDPEAMRNGLAKASVGLKRLVTSQPRVTGGDSQKMSQQWELLESRVIDEATIASDAPDNAALRTEVNLYTSSSDPVEKQRAKTRIMQMMMTPEFVDRLSQEPVFKNLKNNTRINPYVQSTLSPVGTGNVTTDSTAQNAGNAMTEAAEGTTTGGGAQGSAQTSSMSEEEAAAKISSVIKDKEVYWYTKYQEGKMTPEMVAAFEEKLDVPAGSFEKHMEYIRVGLEADMAENEKNYLAEHPLMSPEQIVKDAESENLFRKVDADIVDAFGGREKFDAYVKSVQKRKADAQPKEEEKAPEPAKPAKSGMLNSLDQGQIDMLADIILDEEDEGRQRLLEAGYTEEDLIEILNRSSQ